MPSSDDPRHVECRIPLSLSYFENLAELEVDRCKPILIRNLRQLGHSLQRVVFTGSLNSLEEFIAVEDPELRFPRLLTLSVSRNCIPFIHPCISNCPVVKRLDMSHNIIRQLENLDTLIALEVLDLSYNMIESLVDVHIHVGGIRSLILRYVATHNFEGW